MKTLGGIERYSCGQHIYFYLIHNASYKTHIFFSHLSLGSMKVEIKFTFFSLLYVGSQSMNSVYQSSPEIFWPISKIFTEFYFALWDTLYQLHWVLYCQDETTIYEYIPENRYFNLDNTIHTMWMLYTKLGFHHFLIQTRPITDTCTW